MWKDTRESGENTRTWSLSPQSRDKQGSNRRPQAPEDIKNYHVRKTNIREVGVELDVIYIQEYPIQ